MNPLVAALGCLAFYVLGYRFYARFLSARIFRLDPTRATPAHTLRDEIDYVPTNRFILFGHHYASITGLAPMLGPNLKQIINQMHWKPPGANAEFGFHQDSRSRRPRSAYRELAASYIQTGIAIDPHSAENGAMTICPDSHRLGELPFDPNRPSMHQALDTADLERLGIGAASTVVLEMEPGDVALWHVHTLHGSGPNRAAIDRRLYINGYVIAENCDRGEWAFRNGIPCPLSGEPVLVHYEDLHTNPGPMFVD